MTATGTEKPEKRRREFVWNLAAVGAYVVFSFILALIAALFIRAFIAQSFKIPSAAMEPTLLVGDHIIVDKNVYGFKVPFTQEKFFKKLGPQRGDVIVFIYPKDRTKTFVKRVIGIGGDTVQISNKHVIIDGKELPSPHAVWWSKEIYPGNVNARDNMKPFKVPERMLFVMGDNRDFSYDSRFWGFVPVDDVIGKVSMVYLSTTKSGTFRWDRFFKPVN